MIERDTTLALTLNDLDLGPLLPDAALGRLAVVDVDVITQRALVVEALLAAVEWTQQRAALAARVTLHVHVERALGAERRRAACACRTFMATRDSLTSHCLYYDCTMYMYNGNEQPNKTYIRDSRLEPWHKSKTQCTRSKGTVIHTYSTCTCTL